MSATSNDGLLATSNDGLSKIIHFYQTPQGINKFIEVCCRKQIHIIEQMIEEDVDFNVCVLKNNKIINLVGIMIRYGIIDILDKIEIDYSIHDTRNINLFGISIRYNNIIPQVFTLKHINEEMFLCAFKFKNYKLLNYFIYTANIFNLFDAFASLVDIDNIHVFIECGIIVSLNRTIHCYYSNSREIMTILIDNGYVIRKDTCMPVIFYHVDEFLIDYFGVDFVSINNITPLYTAIARYDEKGVKLLISKGVKVDDESKMLAIKNNVFMNLLFDICPLCREVSNFKKIVHFNKNKNQCIICLEEKNSLYYYECGHVNICEDCYAK